MQTLKVNDNQLTKKAEYENKIPNLTSKVVDKTLEQLEKEGIFVFPELLKESDDLTKDQMVLQGYNDGILTGNVMGFIGYNDERLTISSRFGGENDYFFQYLLERVLDFPNIIDLKTDASQEDKLFNYLLFLFPYYLKSVMRKGIFKQYVWHRYNDSNAKGTIDIKRHIKSNTPFVGKISYNQREFSYDNYLTELIRHTIEYIKRKPYGSRILVKVKEEVDLIVSTTQAYERFDLTNVIEINKKKPIRHAYYREYSALQRLCLLILQHRKHQVGTGPKQIYGILFDGAWLWEEYINTLIGKDFYHPMNKSNTGVQYLFSDGKSGPIYPDFIGNKTENRIVADAKYKPFGNINGSNFFQILTYMYRFDAKRGYLLYPEKDNKEAMELYLNKGTTYENNVSRREETICVKKQGLIIPKETGNYNDFKNEILKAEKEFVDHVNKCN